MPTSSTDSRNSVSSSPCVPPLPKERGVKNRITLPSTLNLPSSMLLESSVKMAGRSRDDRFRRNGPSLRPPGRSTGPHQPFHDLPEGRSFDGRLRPSEVDSGVSQPPERGSDSHSAGHDAGNGRGCSSPDEHLGHGRTNGSETPLKDRSLSQVNHHPGRPLPGFIRAGWPVRSVGLWCCPSPDIRLHETTFCRNRCSTTRSSCQRSTSHLALMGFRPLQRVKQGKRPTPGLPDPAVQRLQAF